MKVCMVRPKYYSNVYSVLRLADGIEMDEVLIVNPSSSIRKYLEKKMVKDRYPYARARIFDTTAQLLEYIQGDYKVVMEITPVSKDIRSFKWRREPTIVVGPEDGSVPEEVLSSADDIVYLPMRGKVRCLNVSCAATIAVWDYIVKSLIGGDISGQKEDSL